MNRCRVLGELITLKSTRGLHLDGILYQNDRNPTTIIHVHGSLGNFYQNQFVRLMAKSYLEAQVNLLSINVSGHDGFGEGYRNVDDFEYVGGAVSDFTECVSDIEGAVRFAKSFSDEILLQGHSLGCDRVLYFLTECGSHHDFILLSPCDSYQLQTNWLFPERVEHQIARLKAVSRECELHWLPPSEYGIRQQDWTYSIPVTLRTLLSIMEGPPFRLMNLSAPSKIYLDQRAFIYIGGEDRLQTVPCNIMYEYLEKRIRHVTRAYIANGDHNLAGCEQKVIDDIVSWTASRGQI